MEIIFIRHADKEGMGENPSLTKKGIKQAKYLAKRLRKFKKFDEFYCSNLDRAKRTAEIVSKKIRVRPRVKESLNEFETEIFHERKPKWGKKEKRHYEELISFLKKISKNPDDKKRVLIICHGLTNRIILSYFLELDLDKTIRFRQRETGINSIYWVDKFENWRLKYWNDNNHIPERFR
ncbi:MAG: histidine phosphatase family protein [Candidatus Pacearchaeota archaeon]